MECPWHAWWHGRPGHAIARAGRPRYVAAERRSALRPCVPCRPGHARARAGSPWHDLARTIVRAAVGPNSIRPGRTPFGPTSPQRDNQRRAMAMPGHGCPARAWSFYISTWFSTPKPRSGLRPDARFGRFTAKCRGARIQTSQNPWEQTGHLGRSRFQAHELREAPLPNCRQGCPLASAMGFYRSRFGTLLRDLARRGTLGSSHPLLLHDFHAAVL
jgi:hypothetical protein